MRIHISVFVISPRHTANASNRPVGPWGTTWPLYVSFDIVVLVVVALASVASLASAPLPFACAMAMARCIAESFAPPSRPAYDKGSGEGSGKLRFEAGGEAEGEGISSFF